MRRSALLVGVTLLIVAAWWALLSDWYATGTLAALAGFWAMVFGDGQ